MRQILRALKRVWILNFMRRVWLAASYFNGKYAQILRWGMASNEDTNFTYHLTESSLIELAHFVAAVTGQPMATIRAYIDEAINDRALQQHILDGIARSGLARFADKEVRFGRRLGWYAFVRALKPKVVIETGVDKGLGSVLLCAAVLRNRAEGHEGQFFGTDINPEAGYLLSGPYAEAGRVLYGDSIASLTQFDPPIDLFINDSDHSADYEYREYQTIFPKLAPQGIILGDNGHATDKLVRFSTEVGRKYLFFQERPLEHWYPGSGIGVSF